MKIDPGEAVFVLTHERIKLPANMTATLIPKRKISHEGILTLGGLLVDPLYEGKLLVGLYNFSSTPFNLIPGRKLIAAMFHELGEDEIGDFPPSRDPIETFPDELVRLIRSYQPVSTENLLTAIQKTQQELTALKTEIQSDKKWQEDFRRDLDVLKDILQDQSANITKTSANLEAEGEIRISGDDALKKSLEKVQHDHLKTATKLGIIIASIVIVSTALLGTLATIIATKYFL